MYWRAPSQKLGNTSKRPLDIHFTANFLSAPIRPKLFIVEYNAKFPSPVEFQITYDSAHRWQLDDYFGASLCSFVRLFSAHKYMLV